MNWLRLYVDVLEDRRFHDMPAELYRRWTFLLMLTRKHGGCLPSVSDIAWSLRLSQDEAEATVRDLIELELIDQTSDGLCPHNWTGRQYDSDSSTERVRRHRDRQRNAAPPVEGNVTRNVPVTPDGTHQIQRQNRTESLPSGSGADAPAPTRKGWIEHHPCFEPLVAAVGGRPGGREWSMWGLQLTTLMEKASGMTAEAVAKEIPRRARQWPKVMGADADGTPILMTLPAFVKHWHALAVGGNLNGATHQPAPAYQLDPETQALVDQHRAARRQAGPNNVPGL